MDHSHILQKQTKQMHSMDNERWPDKWMHIKITANNVNRRQIEQYVYTAQFLAAAAQQYWNSHVK